MFFGSKMMIALCVMLPLLALPVAESVAVMSVDLGSEWIKVGIVSPGVPMEIVLNKESKRKSPAVVAFRDGVRTFGEDAVNIGIRFPKNSYKYLVDLLGKPFEHPIVQAYMERFPYYEIRADETNGRPIFVHDETTTFSPEELVAQLLGKCKELAEISAGQAITEAVITVPGFFNQVERRAVVDAATLAGLKVLQLINDYTAVAINYGIFRRKEINETASHAIFFDMGALSTKAALVEYRLIKIKEKGYVETVPQLQVIGVAYDRTLGGLEITWRLREHLIEGWRKSGGSDLRNNPRAMEKLLKEAERLKVVLSANTEHYAQIESLHEEKDFKMIVTRADLEEMCADVWPRASSVVARALAAAGGAGVGARGVVAGGAARVPKLQQALRDALGHEPSRGINADEAATLGAVYRAASLAKGYKVAPLQVKDAVILPVQVTFTRHTDGQDKVVKRTLFGHMNPYPQKKVITFNKHTGDFSFYVSYAELDHLPSAEVPRVGPLNLTHVSLEGVGEAYAKHTGENVEHKGIKAHFSMDDSGILSLVNVEFVAEKTVTEEEEDSTLSKLGSTISKLFGSEKEEPKPELKTEEPKTEESTRKNDTSKNDTEKPSEKANATDTEAKTPKPKIVVLKEPIKSEEEVVNLPPLSAEVLKKSKAKIDELDLIDKKRAERETALNNLESFVIDTQLKMDMDEFKECATPEEVEEIKSLCSKVSEWLYDDGYDATTELYREKLANIQAKTDPIFYKHWEHRERPDAVAALRNMLNSTQTFLNMAKNNTKDKNPDRDIFTEVEITVLATKITDTESWLNKSIEEQASTKNNEPVKLTVDGIREKMSALDREVKYLLNKMKIWRPKKPPTPPKTEGKSNDSATEKEIPVIEILEALKAEKDSADETKGVEEAQGAEELEAGTEEPKQKEPVEDEHSEL